jgi:hypothetical protein
MGTWGLSIRSDDVVMDVIGGFEDILKKKQSLKAATAETIKSCKEEIADSDDGPLFWLGLADVQWKYGSVDKKVLAKVKSDFNKRKGLDGWREASEKLYAKRVKVIAEFIKKIEKPNKAPKPFPKTVVRKPLFEAGDCLSVAIAKGKYGAAFVTAEDTRNPEYGTNLVVVLDYLSAKKPTLKDFHKRNWLYLTHHSWENELDASWYSKLGFLKEKSKFELVGKIPVLKSDPLKSNTYSGWALIGQGIVGQRAWDAKHKKPSKKKS